MTPRPWVLAECSWATVRAAGYEVAILPWGATEAHNTHLPYATDTVQAEAVAIESARQAWDRGAKVVVLPAMPFGVQTGQREVPLCLNANPSTQALLLRDLATSVASAGVRKLVILNGHGGNDFKQMIRELQGVVPLLLCQVNWYQAVDPKPFFAHPGDHAGEARDQRDAAPRPRLGGAAGPGGSRKGAAVAGAGLQGGVGVDAPAVDRGHG